MSYRIRSARRLAKKSKRRFLTTLILIGFIVFATINWILPNFINGIGFIKGIVQPSKKSVSPLEENPLLSAPVLIIPYEATNSSEINIGGNSTPNSKVKLYLDDEEKQTTEVRADGSFTFKNVALSIGTNNIYSKSVDEKDKMSLPSKTFKIIYDNEKPQLTIYVPEDDKKIQGGDKKVKISGKTEAGVKVFINDSQIIVDKDGNFSNDFILNDGENTINFKSVDLGSNSTEIQRKVTYNP